jgi:cyclopropane fatty-acyl-phospholipid synthase-like methyltransferase
MRYKLKQLIQNVFNYFGLRIAKICISESIKIQRLDHKLNEMQMNLAAWSAKRNGLMREDVEKRYLESICAFENGHGGSEFRSFCDLSYKIFSPLFGDTPGELYNSYQFYGPLHLLRMASYPDNGFLNEDDILGDLSSKDEVVILDFGCGLAQKSRSIAKKLKAIGRKTHLLLADISTIRKDFLIWLCENEQISCTFYDCTEAKPIPEFPAFDVLVATEVFEHVNNPVKYFDILNQNLKTNGIMITNVCDHTNEFMHISPRLEPLKKHILNNGFLEVQENTIFKKII